MNSQQPQATQGMSIGGGNRNAKGLPIGAEGREWSHGLFDCLEDAQTFIVAWFCPCIVYAHNKQRLEHLDTKGSPDPEHGGELTQTSNDCITHGALHACCGLGWFFQMGTRANTRSRYGIRGQTPEDCLSSWLCSPCSLTQESREIELEEQSLGGGGGAYKV